MIKINSCWMKCAIANKFKHYGGKNCESIYIDVITENIKYSYAFLYFFLSKYTYTFWYVGIHIKILTIINFAC